MTPASAVDGRETGELGLVRLTVTRRRAATMAGVTGAEQPDKSGSSPLSVRVSYLAAELSESQAPGHWLPLLQQWYDEAAAHPWIAEPNAIQLATVDADGGPDVRTVLARGFDLGGVSFFTNYDSTKGRQLAVQPRAAGLFSWLPLQRQIRLRGRVEQVSRLETEQYWASRPRGSQLGSWASEQSTVLASRAVLEQHLAAVTERFADREVPAPPNWGGFRLSVEVAEFWQGREFRLHDRLRYRAEAGAWVVERLAP